LFQRRVARAGEVAHIPRPIRAGIPLLSLLCVAVNRQQHRSHNDNEDVSSAITHTDLLKCVDDGEILIAEETNANKRKTERR
jgi:hypothetical protein